MAATDNFQVDGLVQQRKELEAILTSNPEFEKKVQKVIRKVLLETRRIVMAEAKAGMKTDLRQAYKAVKITVYRQILGGSVSILNKKNARKSGAPISRPIPTGRGGNRRSRSQRTIDLQSYWGADRAFVLRFLNAGTDQRTIRNYSINTKRHEDRWNKHPNTGNRGSIAPRNFFSTSSHKAMKSAAGRLTQYIDELIKQELQ